MQSLTLIPMHNWSFTYEAEAKSRTILRLSEAVRVEHVRMVRFAGIMTTITSFEYIHFS